MFKRLGLGRAAALAGALGVAVVAWHFVASPVDAFAADVDGDGREQTATWIVDPARHVTPGYMQVVVTTSTGLDYGTETTVSDPRGNVLIATSGGAYDPLTPADREVLDVDLAAYPSGTIFTISTNFLDGADVVIDVEAVQFSKP